MTLFFSTELITIARVFLFISTALPHVFVTLMDAVSRFNFLFFVILAFKDNSWENTQFFRISLDCFSPSSRAFRRSSSNAADSVTPDWSERSSRAVSWNGSALKSSIQRIKSCTACSSFFILLGGIPHTFDDGDANQVVFKAVFILATLFTLRLVQKSCVSFCNNWSHRCFSFESRFRVTLIRKSIGWIEYGKTVIYWSRCSLKCLFFSYGRDLSWLNNLGAIYHNHDCFTRAFLVA